MGLSKITSEILFTHETESELSEIISRYPKGKVFLASEDTVKKYCFPKIQDTLNRNSIPEVIILSGEENKGIGQVEKIWAFLSQNGADRKSLLINLGGGKLTDLAGFAATTFKRGMDFVNIPTTLLAQVDASVGGKTGINFNGLKNEIGTFQEPNAVIIDTGFLKTIGQENFLSGFAEMVKHGLIKSPEHLEELKNFNLEKIDYAALQEAIRHSVEIKKYFVENDPTEKNIRKALNFGHTAGHAFESLAMIQNRPILHGYAVAYGMMAELFLSAEKNNFGQAEMKKITGWLLSVYGKFEISGSDFETLFHLMTHDKKNENGRINFTLLSGVGSFEINCNCPKELVFEALKFYSKL